METRRKNRKSTRLSLETGNLSTEISEKGTEKRVPETEDQKTEVPGTEVPTGLLEMIDQMIVDGQMMGIQTGTPSETLPKPLKPTTKLNINQDKLSTDR
jgi:hypothetical protein